MPRVDFKLWDRVYILKLICTAQATYSSFVVLIYIYLIVLQNWTTAEDDRSDVMKFKWSVIAVGTLEFGLGILLAFAANMTGIRSKIRILIWIISETFLIPISIFLLMQLQKRLNNSNKYHTDTHYLRVNIAQVCFLLAQYLCIAYAIDFLVQGQRKAKTYDPSIRPKSVYAPTDPQITTTESRHIRMSQSLLFQPSSSKALSRNSEREGSKISIELSEKHLPELKMDEENKVLRRRESEMWRIRKNVEADTNVENFETEIKKAIYPWPTARTDSKDEQWIKEEKVEWLEGDDKERKYAGAQEKECTEGNKEWKREEGYWMGDVTELVSKESHLKENEGRLELEGKSEETKPTGTSNISESNGN